MRAWRFAGSVSCAALVLVLGSGAPAVAQQGTPPQAPPPQQAQPQEDKSGGFVIGFGGGYGWSNWQEAGYQPPCYFTNYYNYYCPPAQAGSSSHGGVTTNFKIGAAINHRFLILFHATNTFFSTQYEGTVGDGMAGGDLQVHVAGRKGRSVYVFGGAGYHNIMHLNFDDPYSNSNSFGLGVRGGAGFEFVKYLTVEFHVQHGFNEAEHNPTTWAVTVNFLKR